jgi:hypothetical protein
MRFVRGREDFEIFMLVLGNEIRRARVDVIITFRIQLSIWINCRYISIRMKVAE